MDVRILERQTTKSDVKLLARALVDLRDRVIQKARIQFGNRLAALENGSDESPYRYYLQKWYERFAEIEKDLDASIADIAGDFPIVERMTNVKGVGKTLALKVVAMIDIERARTISALWRYAGYGVVDGKAERPKPGERLHYNKRLKTTCYLVGTSMLRSNSPYCKIYDEARDYYAANRPDWTRAHQHNAAMRKMIKIWLAHLWQVWRDMEGLPVGDPYIAADPHHTIIRPEEMGW